MSEEKFRKCKMEYGVESGQVNPGMIQVILAFIITFLAVLLILPSVIRMLRSRGIYGIDVHKPDKPKVPKGGGFVVLFAIVTTLLVLIGATTFIEQGNVNIGLLAALVSILMAGMIGLLDDNLDFSNRVKIIMPLLASIPMMALNVGTTTMSIPLIGTIDFGVVYPLVIIPLMMTFIIDSTNMYGGMNGLETGLVCINSSAIVVYLLARPLLNIGTIADNEMDAAVVAAALLGASLAFMWFNKYPAKVLPGDVGRLPMGATIAAALILGNMDRMAIVLYIPYLINFLMYLIYRIYVKKRGIEYIKFATPREDGTLEVVGPFTMYWLFPFLSKKITEKRNVILLLLLQAIIAYSMTIYMLIT